jgi:hypothetical protein
MKFMKKCGKIYGTAQQATDDNTMWCMSIACWITKAINSHSEYKIFITFPWQQWLLKHISILCYKYNACPVSYCSVASKVLIYIIFLCRCACSIVFNGWTQSTWPDAVMIPTAGKRLRKQWLPIASACGLKRSMHQLANLLPSLRKMTEKHASG